MHQYLTKLTENCEFKKCLIAKINTTSTLLGTVQTFDKEGNLRTTIDHNTVSTDYQCLNCGQTWTVTKQGENVININTKDTFLFRRTE